MRKSEIFVEKCKFYEIFMKFFGKNANFSGKNANFSGKNANFSGKNANFSGKNANFSNFFKNFFFVENFFPGGKFFCRKKISHLFLSFKKKLLKITKVREK